MAELTKQDLEIILEVILLKFDGQELHKLIGFNIKTKHMLMADKLLEDLKLRW